jgi:predicted NBD/HSP70 family sugar kinase
MPAATHSASRAVDLVAVRRHNLSLILGSLRRGPHSRAELAKLTGLGKVTVSSLAAELLGAGLIVEAGAPVAAGKGRPAQPLALSSERVVGLGMELEVDRLSVALVDLTGRLRARQLEPGDNRGLPQAQVLRRLGRLARGMLRTAERQGHTVASAAVSVPGLVDARTGRLLFAPNLGWSDVDVAAALAPALGRPRFGFAVENEANACALAERAVGALPEHFVHVSLGVGVGAGVVMGGELFHGARGFGGELGHTCVVPGGPPCSCGNRGCLEALVGKHALCVAARRALGKAARGAANDEAVIERLRERAEAGHAQSRAVIKQAARYLGAGLCSYANLFDPELVVLGGWGATLAKLLVPTVRAELQRQVLGARWAPVAVRAAAAGEDARLLGAAQVALERLFCDPTLATRSHKA